MKDLKESKEFYDSIEIPEELNDVVQMAIAKAKKKKGKNRQTVVIKAIRYGMTAAAAVVMALTIGLNSNEAFANELCSHPVLGGIARVLTIRSYYEFDEEKGIEKEISIPAIEVVDQDTKEAQENGLTEEINKEIRRIIEEHMVQSEEDFALYKKTFFENGGTEEEWMNRTMEIDADYEIMYQDDTRVSLRVEYSEASAFAEEKEYYYNLNLKEEKIITLEDILGEDYISIVNSSIKEQIANRMEENEELYYWNPDGEEEDPEIKGFSTIDETTGFYINEAGNPVITFGKYEIAPGYMGAQEFEIIK